MENKKIKKKLTLSGTSKKVSEPLQYIRGKNKTSVVIEKKIYRKKVDRNFFQRDKKTSFGGPNKNVAPNINLNKNKSVELRKLAEQKATRRIKDDTVNNDKLRKVKSSGFGKKREYKLTISRALDEEAIEGKERSLASVKRARLKVKKTASEIENEKKHINVKRDVNIPNVITIRELANRMAEQSSSIIKHLLGMGVTATINHTIDSDTAEYLVKEFGHNPIKEEKVDLKFNKLSEEDSKLLKIRPPIVTVMGHVDHGKTSLLDSLRETNVVSEEHGGITQHIGAYQISVNKKNITFIDTPGHAAFTEMRARGSKVTDLVVLVVAADDGVKPQTVEAIKHSKAANVPIVVAINKCDVSGADPQKIKNQLLEYELIAEDLSGETLFAEISATKKTNINKLIENINLQAEILDLKANPNTKAVGVVLESKIDKGRGPVSTILITNGTLKKGDFFVSGVNWGKVRAMIDCNGKNIESALPSAPVEILGMNNPGNSGNDFIVVENEAKAKEISDYRIEEIKFNKNPLVAKSKESFFENFKKTKELSIIIKSDVFGSSEALKNAINKIKHEEVTSKIVSSDVGLISETDVSLAKATDSILLGFNVKASKEAKKLAENYKIEIKYFSIIYEAIDYITKSLSGLLKPEIKEEVIGSLEVLEIFKVSKIGKVAGSKVLDGEVKINSNARLIRDGKVVYTGLIGSLYREKNATKQVGVGLECGITLKDFADYKKNDVIEVYKINETERVI